MIINDVTLSADDLDMVCTIGEFSYYIPAYSAEKTLVPTTWVREEVVITVDVGEHPIKGHWEHYPSVDCGQIKREWVPARLEVKVKLPQWRNHLSHTLRPDLGTLVYQEEILDLTHLEVELPQVTTEYVWDEKKEHAYYSKLIKEKVLPAYEQWKKGQEEKERAAQAKARAEQDYLSSEEHQAALHKWEPVITWINANAGKLSDSPNNVLSQLTRYKAELKWRSG